MTRPPLRATCALLVLCLVTACSEFVREPPVTDLSDGGELREEVPPDFPNEAALWRMQRYRDENGAIPPRAWQRALEERQRTVQATAARPESSAGVSPLAWRHRGPDNVAGRARAIVIDPRDPQRIFVGSVSGGLWRSDDGGSSWQILDDWWSNLSCGCVAMDPSDPDVLYVGTGEGFYSLAHLARNLSHFVRGAGVLKSTDGGATWSQLPGTAGWEHVTRIAVSPSDPNLVLAARRPGGIARSTDGGLTWTDVASGDFSYQVVFDPNDGTRAVAHFAPTSALTHQVLTSTDSGATWQPASSGLNNLAGENFRIELAYARSVPGMVYASVGSTGEVWRSTDGGRNWTLRTGSGSNTGARYYYNGLWVDPTNADRVVVSALHVWRSLDGGQSFTQITNGYIMTVDPHLDAHAVVADPSYDGSSNRRLYVATDGGLHVADDILAAGSGTGWRDLDGSMRSTQFYGAAGHVNGDVLIGGTQDNGTLRVRGASSTANLVFGGDGGQVQIDPTNPSYSYGEYQYLGVHRSTDGGASARTITSGLGDFSTGNANFISPLRLDPNEPRRLYAGGASLWRTTDARASSVGWTAVKAPNGSLIAAIGLTPGRPEVVYVGTNDGRLDRTANATAGSPSWAALDDNAARDPLPDRVLTRLVVDPRATDTVYASFGGFAADNLWRSTDAGQSWQVVTGTAPFALPSAPVYGLAIHPDDSAVLYAATEVGVFTSDDGGAHWGASNDGPANVVCEEISFQHGSRRLVLATLGRGLWTADAVRPAVAPFGSACAGLVPPPRLSVDPLAPPRLGRDLRFLGADLGSGTALATLMVGTSNTNWAGLPLPFALDGLGLTGCVLYTSIDFGVNTPVAPTGDALWVLPVPPERLLLGAHAFAQILLPRAGVNPAGLVTSGALDLTLGW